MQTLKKTRRKHNNKKDKTKRIKKTWSKKKKENSKNNIYKQKQKYMISSPQTSAKGINNIKTNTKENIKKKQTKQKSPSQTLRDIYFSQRFVGWKSCISVLFYVFLWVVYVVFSVSLCLLCFRLVFLSFCIYNRTNT